MPFLELWNQLQKFQITKVPQIIIEYFHFPAWNSFPPYFGKKHREIHFVSKIKFSLTN